MPNNDDDKNNGRAARAAAEMKETEDLLAGFDRPGRTPRAPPVRDFVDYHMKKERSDPNAGRASRDPPPPEPKRVVEPTFVIPRKKSSYPSWLPWLALLIAMPSAGGLVAYCTLSSSANDARGTSPLPSAATTISAASTPSGAERDIPAPPPPTPTPIPTTSVSPSTIVAPPSASFQSPGPPPNTSQRPASANSAAPTPSGSNTRVDFIRTL